MTALADEEERRRIREDLDQTLVVEAAAGTGKTTMLVERILGILASGRGELSRLVAVTFTEKAAGEMKLRLRAELDRARAAEGPTSERRARLDRALAELEVARIGTIHSFCADLLRERPLEAGVDPDFRVLAEEQQAALVEEVFDRWFQRALQDPPEGLRRFLARRGVRRGGSVRELLASACAQLIDHRDHPAPWRRPRIDRAEEIEALLDEIGALGALRARARNPRDYLARSLAPLEELAARVRARSQVSPPGPDALDQIEGELCDLAGRLDKRKGSGRQFGEGLLRADVLSRREALRERLGAFAARAEADVAALLFAELWPVVEAYGEASARLGALDFVDLLARTRDLLRDRAEVRAELQERFTHIFVDEFQDTDPLQTEILLLLAADDPAVDRADQARPVPGKLFVVGDPKQSIYRFRRADIDLYRRVVDRLVGAGAELLRLRTSFRAVPAIQAAVNHSFSRLMDGAAPGQADYVELAPSRQPRAGQPAVIALPVPAPFGRRGDITRWAVSESVPDAVAALVDWLLRESGWRIEDPASKERVPIESRHVCLLFRRLSTATADIPRPYVRALEARRLPHVLVGGRSFHQREEVVAIRSVLQAIEWPDDELHVYATLRGPLLSIADDRLLEARAEIGRLHPLAPEPAPEIRQRHGEVLEALSLLRDLHLGRNRRPIADTLTRMLEATRAHAGIAIWPTGEQALANVLSILEDARRFESRGATSFRCFVDHLERRAERGRTGQAPVVEEGAEGVRVMTVHRAKGLEFPVVILCDPTCSRKSRRPSRFIDPEAGLWAAPLARCTPAELRDRAGEVLAADDAEEVRIGYVAATRARDLLVVPATGEGRAEGWVDVLHPALYPEESRRRPRPAPGCPTFGDDSVLVRPPSAPMTAEGAVAPGLHRVGAGEVVWWDPRALALDAQAPGGIRQQEILIQGGERGESREREDHQAWKVRRARVLETASRPTLRAEAATRAAGERGAAEVPVERAASRERARPGGRRFGTLVHAVLADVPLDPDRERVARAAELHARLLGATEEETAAACRAVLSALDHPLLRRAAAAEKRGECRREEPLLLRQRGGGVVDGVVDLAFREDGRWIVVDFKTDAAPESEPAYAAQAILYAEAIADATGEPAAPVLLAV